MTNLAKACRWIVIAVWLAIVVLGTAKYISDPGAFSPQNIAAFVARFQGEIWFAYFGISIIRGFTLLPSTPLVLAGTLLFPAHPMAVLLISVTGIILSSSMIYFFSEQLGFSGFFERRNSNTVERIRNRLQNPTGVAFVAVWSFFPLVPTDLICYVAGVVRMQYAKFIAALFVGELVLCSIYVFLGRSLVDLFRSI